MSIDITGDGPRITATGSGSAITLTVTTGSGGGGGSPTGGAGGALSGSYPNPGLNEEIVQDLVGAMAGTGLSYDDATGVINADGELVVVFQHFTNLADVATAPHPFGAFLAEGSLVELVGQTVDAENGTYVAPANAASNPLVRADDQLLVQANAGRQVTVLRSIQGPYVYGPLEWIVSTDVTGRFVFSPQSGVTLFALKELDLANTALGAVDFDGAVAPGSLVLVVGATSSTDDGIWKFVADGSPMVKSRIEAGVGTTVRSMIDGGQWTRTPHSGWVRASINADAVTMIGAGLDFGLTNAQTILRNHEGALDTEHWVRAFSTVDVDLSLYTTPVSSVAVQPTLSESTQPVTNADLLLVGQTDPTENGVYHVDDPSGVWSRINHPNILIGNSFVVTVNAPGLDVDGDKFEWIDDDPDVVRRRSFGWPGSSDGESDGSGGRFLRYRRVTPAAAPPSHTHYASGSIYMTPNVTVGGTREIRASRATATPLLIPAAVTIDALQVDLSAVVADATPIDLHLFATSDGYPTGAPVASASVVTVGTGAQILSGTTATPVELAAGAYWAVIHNRAASVDHVTARAVNAAQHLEPLPYSTGTTQVSCYLTNSGAVGTTAITAFPAVASTTQQNQGPLMQFRVD